MVRLARHQIHGLLITVATLLAIAGVMVGTAVHAAAAPDLSGIGLTADSGQQHGWVMADADLYAKAAKSALWDRTPSGMIFHSCDYGSLPNGSHVDTVKNTITLPNGIVKPIEPCAYPRVEQPKSGNQHTTGNPAPPAGANGWFQGFVDYRSVNWTDIVGNVAAPSGPQTPNTQSNFAWSGLTNGFVASGSGYTSAGTIAQTVVGWGSIGTGRPISTNPTANGSGPWLWEAAYYYWNGNAVAGTVQTVHAADTLTFEIYAPLLNCSDVGICQTWVLDALDNNNNHDSTISITTGAYLFYMVGGMYEKANLAGCNQTFGNGHLAWRNWSYYAWDEHNFYHQVRINPYFLQDVVDQECSMNTAYSLSGGDITWVP